jgi:hypothetical protein
MRAGPRSTFQLLRSRCSTIAVAIRVLLVLVMPHIDIARSNGMSGHIGVNLFGARPCSVGRGDMSTQLDPQPATQ